MGLPYARPRTSADQRMYGIVRVTVYSLHPTNVYLTYKFYPKKIIHSDYNKIYLIKAISNVKN